MRYLASAPAATVIILVSEDKMVDLLPDLRPLMRRSHLQALLSRLRDAATADPVDAERFYKAYDRVKAASFYLSPEQCAEANTLRVEHWKRRKAAGAQVRAYDTPLVPNPEMSEAYLTD